MLRILLTCAAVFGLLLSCSASSDTHQNFEIGVAVSQQAPELHALDSQGQGVTLKSLSGEKGLVLIFFRSADWCPFCKRHLIEINQDLDRITAKGYRIAGISYDSVEILRAFSEQENIRFPLLADQDSATINGFGLLNTDYEPGQRHYGIPYPGALVINNKGVVTYKYFYQGYKDRVQIDTLLSELK